MNVHLRLRVKLPWGEDQIFPFYGREMCIGRGPECQIKINDPEISRKHALLKYISPQKIRVTDLESTNGTYVRGILITSETTLTPGTMMKVGETYIIFESAVDDSFLSFDLVDNSFEFIPWSPISQAPKEKVEGILNLTRHLIKETGFGKLNILLTQITELLDGENSFICLSESGNWTSQTTRVVRGDKVQIPYRSLKDVVELGKMMLISNPDAFKELKSNRPSTAMAAPIRDTRNIWGSIYLDRRKSGEPFTKADINLLSQICHLISAAFEKQRYSQIITQENDGLQQQKEMYSRVIHPFADLPLKSQNRKFQQLLFKAMRVASTKHPVLIIGARGSGRTLLAQRIHSESERKDQAFIVVNCNLIPKSLLEEEILGLEVPREDTTKPEKRGFLEIADGGTLFLQELSVLPVSLQGQIAQAVQHGSYKRKGGHLELSADIRLVTSTDVDINRMLNAEMLHPKLYELVKSTILEVPSLKNRKEDIIPLSKYFLRNYLPKNRPVPEFSHEVTSLLHRYLWPGNIDELAHTMRFVAAICDDHRIELGDLPRSIRDLLSPSFDSQEPLRKQMDRLEMEIIRNALERNNRIVTRAAKELGLSESTLRYRMYRLGLTNEKNR